MILIITLFKGLGHKYTDESSILDQFWFFLPLAATSVLITITHSLFNAGLTRLPSPEIYIAAFAVAKSLMHTLECPVMMIRQTVTSLVDGRDSFLKIKRTMVYLIVIIVVIIAVLAITDVGRFIFKNIMGLEGATLDAAVTILRVLILFPIAASTRNFYHGIAIKLRMNTLVTIATTVRIIFVVLVVVFIRKLSFIDPGVVAGSMFIGSVFIEAGVMFFGVRMTVKDIPGELELQKANRLEERGTPIDYLIIARFLSPLIVTAFIKTMVSPLINTGLARTVSPEIALSVFAVAWGLGMIVVSPLTMFHQVAITYVDDNDEEKTRKVRWFGLYLGVGLAVAIGIMAFTDIGYYILIYLIGAGEEISRLSVEVLKFMTVMPFTIAAIEYYFGMLMKRRLTKYIGIGKVVQIGALVIGLVGMSFVSPANPAMIGVVAVIFADGIELVYLYFVSNRTKPVEEPSHSCAATTGA